MIHLLEWTEYQMPREIEFSLVKLSFIPIFCEVISFGVSNFFLPLGLYPFTWLPLYSEKPAMLQCNKAAVEYHSGLW